MPFAFSHVCKLLTDLERVFTRDPPLTAHAADQEACRVVEYWFRCHRAAVDAGSVDGIALLSTLFPERRSDRVFALKEFRLSKSIARCLRLSQSRTRLLESYTTPGNGDLGACVQKLLKDFDCEQKPGAFVPTVEEIDAALGHLASSSRFSGPAVRNSARSCGPDDVLSPLFSRLKSDEAKWFTRLLLKTLSPVRMPEWSTLAEYHFLLPDLLRLQDDLPAAVQQLRYRFATYPSKPDLASRSMAKTEVSRLLQLAVGTKAGRQTYVKARSMKHCVAMCGRQKWSAERKYDGEYCEVHVDLTKGSDCLKVFSKSGKDSTQDRHRIHATVKKSLRIGEAGCAFRKHCILLGELVVWSDDRRKMLEFYHIRKHVERSGVCLGREEDSQIKPGEHLMIVWFDVLSVDDQTILRLPYAERRVRLKKLVRCEVGRAITSERITIDFGRADEAKKILCYQFAAAMAARTEGLVLKPLNMPYITISGGAHRNKRDGVMEDYVIKLKKDYLQELGDLRDVADFAVVGASFDAKMMAKSPVRNLKFTGFHLGCPLNREAAVRFGEIPRYKVVGSIHLDQCIQRAELQALNNYTIFNHVRYQPSPDQVSGGAGFSLESPRGDSIKIGVQLTQPCVVEVLGSGFERPSDSNWYMLRHPRILKVHLDRSWRDACTFDELQDLARVAVNSAPEGESQELSQLVKLYDGKFRRKEDRKRAENSSTEPSQTTECTGQSHGSVETALPPQAKRGQVTSAVSTALIRISSTGPEGAQCHTAAESLPTPPTSSAIGTTPNLEHKGRKRARQVSVTEPQHSSKRLSDTETRCYRQMPGVLANVSLSHIKQRYPRVNGADMRADTRTKPAEVSLSAKMIVSTTTIASAQLTCSNTACPFGRSVIFLTTCISGFKWVSDSLVQWHGADVVSSLRLWSRESFKASPLGSVVAESYAYPEQQKMILVESNRPEDTMACVERVKQLGIRDLVLFFDWRVLEDWKVIEARHSQDVDALACVQTLEERFFGFSCWSREGEDVVFMRREMARMPKAWLGD